MAVIRKYKAIAYALHVPAVRRPLHAEMHLKCMTSDSVNDTTAWHTSHLNCTVLRVLDEQVAEAFDLELPGKILSQQPTSIS